MLHLNTINCIFLGGMISMSSTTIILKSFTDLGMKQQKFASLVLSVLIIEDLFAVLMLVLLSSLAMGDVQGPTSSSASPNSASSSSSGLS